MTLLRSIYNSIKLYWSRRKIVRKDSHFFKFTHEHKLYNRSYFPEAKLDNEYAEILKASRIKGIRVVNSYIPAGYEDCIDLVGSEGVVERSILSQTKHNALQGITMKGGSTLLLENCLFMGDFPFAHVTVGDFTIYDAVTDVPKSKLYLGERIRAFDSKSCRIPLLIISLNGEVSFLKPNDDKHIKVIQVPEWIVKIYFKLASMILSSERKEEAKKNLGI